jgi:hypothetical protein
VMWMDSQYLVATPWGKLRWGLLDVPGEQWLEVSHLDIVPAPAAHSKRNRHTASPKKTAV